MLNSDYIHVKISAPETCFSEDSANMKELADLFPFASSFSILYLKSLSNSGDIRLESELEKLAFKINARDILYNLIHSNPIPEIEPEEIIEIEKTEKKQEELIEETEIQQISIDVVSEQIEEDVQLVETKTDTYQDELDKLIVSTALATSFVEKELEPLMDLGSTEKSDFEKVEPFVLTSFEEHVEKKSEEPIINKLSNEITSPKSFTAWLRVVPSDEENVLEEQVESKNTEYYTFEKPKKEFYSPVKKAKESLDENKMPVSETLAKIFALQGNYSKAIYVYEQLILIFPEKKSFFATQIKNLKKKINS